MKLKGHKDASHLHIFKVKQLCCYQMVNKMRGERLHKSEKWFTASVLFLG